uniref:Uncharacterized protein n=1 Tax=Arundo donax TaxID=35708 RepID=A0A0A9F522_ARUDO
MQFLCYLLYIRLHLSISFDVALISFLVLSINSSKRISNSSSAGRLLEFRNDLLMFEDLPFSSYAIPFPKP